MKVSRKPFVRLLAFALALSPMIISSSAKAEGYIGGLVGFGIPFGTSINYDNGSVFGGTIGYHLVPGLGIAATYQHTNLGVPLTDSNIGVDQYLGELNFFSLFGLNGGVHAGSVKEGNSLVSTTNLGFGPHLSMDFKLTNEISIGAAAYWTYVTANDKHSILDIVVPIKLWF
ncbi:MAG: hypothetical protein H7301_00070 [Cryobacterium sp.]|nr:hypothetical protein [Oligoflexia bacterium]